MSKRKADWHFLADAYRDQGWRVLFLTVGLSWASYLRSDHRLGYLGENTKNKVQKVSNNLYSFVLWSKWHPVNLRAGFLNKLTYPLLSHYGNQQIGDAASFVSEADLVLFESTPGLMLFEQLRALNRNGRFVYRASDDPRVVGFHPVVIDAEDKAAPRFDLISLPSPHMRLRNLPNAVVHSHGVDKAAFDNCAENPFRSALAAKHVVSVGGTLFDTETLGHAVSLFPNWAFHIIGWHSGVQAPNVTYYEEMPFVETVPFVKNADVGLALYRYRSGAEYLSHSSLKMLQYTYCRLPIVAPAFACAPERPHTFGYQSGKPASIQEAFAQAASYDRSKIAIDRIPSWTALAEALATDSPPAVRK